jgi:flagellar hook-basal body complex protein FliE
MLSKVSNAVAAYSQAAEALKQSSAVPKAAESGFASLIADALGDVGATVARGEAVSMQAIANQADLNEVVAAVTDAEMALQSVIAVRDRVIQAYNDIIKMPI